MTHLILVRHGESQWNAKGIWTGWTDISLSEKGKVEARSAGRALKGVKIDIAYSSPLIRAKQTLDEIKKILGRENLAVIENKALNERDYGIFTVKNKWEIKKEVGEDKFFQIRRGFDTSIPKGETLKDVYNRVVPYYKKEILKNLIAGKSVLISAHGNSLRALIKHLESISDEEISNLELATGEIYIYGMSRSGKVISKKVLKSS